MLEPKRIVFFDMDGVLVPFPEDGTPETALQAYDRYVLLRDGVSLCKRFHSPAAAKHLAELCYFFNAKLVMHSAWVRIFTDDELYACMDIMGLTRHLHDPLRCAGSVHASRAERILTSVDEYKPDLWVAIDDEPSLHLGDHHRNLILTNPMLGFTLTDKDVAKLRLAGTYR